MKSSPPAPSFAAAFACLGLLVAATGGCDQNDAPTPMNFEVPKDARPEDVTPGKPTAARTPKGSSKVPGPPPGPPEVR